MQRDPVWRDEPVLAHVKPSLAIGQGLNRHQADMIVRTHLRKKGGLIRPEDKHLYHNDSAAQHQCGGKRARRGKCSRLGHAGAHGGKFVATREAAPATTRDHRR